MVPRIPLILATICSILITGCTSQRKPAAARTSSASPATNQVSVGPATQPIDAKANLTLDQIQPIPSLPPTSHPTTSNGKPPLEALELYARARDALASGHQFTAISSLERAIKLDPDSAELNRLLSRAYIAGGNNVKAIDALHRATQLEPDDLRSQTTLARLYLQQGKPADAMDHLRVGLLTKQYADDEAAAGVADYFLAKALQQQGYERAALDQFEKLLGRLSRRTLALRSDAELADWAARPQSIYADVARLYEKRQDYQKALEAWRRLATFDSEDLETRSRIIQMLIALDRPDEALREAASLVRTSGATSRSLEILRDVARRVGREEVVYEELRRLQQERPDDRTLLYARVDLLANNGRVAEAQVTLEQAARAKFDPDIVRRLVRFYSDRAQTASAAKLLIEAATAKPDETPIFLQSYADLLYPLRPDALRASDVQRIAVAPAAEPAKQYFVAIAAANREMLVRESLDRATHTEPFFAPAYRLAMQRVWNRNDLDTAAKEQAAQDLLTRAEQLGPPGVAQELRAYAHLGKSEKPQAIKAFDEAFKVRPPSPEPAMLYANLQREFDNRAKFEQTIWRLISDYPSYGPAYVSLILYHLQSGGNGAAALNALQRWRSADPSGTAPRLTEAQVLIRSPQHQREMAAVLTSLIAENPLDPDVVPTACQTLRDAKQSTALIQALDEQFARNPKNVLIVVELIDTYQELNRSADAIRIADKAHAAAAGDARLLYLVSQAYTRADQKQRARDVLDESHRIDPNDPATNNDLGYTFAEEGINLDRAETMTRLAVHAEPDNGSFLDSLAWVLYKRGQFVEARQQLERAISLDPRGDPVLFDHLGDTLYRLNDRTGAQQQWQRSLEQLVMFPNRQDINAMRPTLEAKLRQAQQGEPVNVAKTEKDEGGRMKDEVGRKDGG